MGRFRVGAQACQGRTMAGRAQALPLVFLLAAIFVSCEPSQVPPTEHSSSDLSRQEISDFISELNAALELPETLAAHAIPRGRRMELNRTLQRILDRHPELGDSFDQEGFLQFVRKEHPEAARGFELASDRRQVYTCKFRVYHLQCLAREFRDTRGREPNGLAELTAEYSEVPEHCLSARRPYLFKSIPPDADGQTRIVVACPAAHAGDFRAVACSNNTADVIKEAAFRAFRDADLEPLRPAAVPGVTAEFCLSSTVRGSASPQPFVGPRRTVLRAA